MIVSQRPHRSNDALGLGRVRHGSPVRFTMKSEVI